MAVDNKYKKKKFVEIPEGTHLALFQGLVHVGIHKNEYQGVVSHPDQVLLMFELPDITLDDGRAVTLTRRESNSFGQRSNLTKVVKALNNGKDDEIAFSELIGKPLMLETKENTKKTGVNITGYMSAPESLKRTVKPLMNKPILLLDVEKIGEKDLKELPEWIQKLINEREADNGEVEPEIDF